MTKVFEKVIFLNGFSEFPSVTLWVYRVYLSFLLSTGRLLGWRVLASPKFHSTCSCRNSL